MSGETQRETNVQEPHGMDYRPQRDEGCPCDAKGGLGMQGARVSPGSELRGCVFITGSSTVLSGGNGGSGPVAKEIHAENERVPLALLL